MNPRMNDEEALVTFRLIAIPFIGAIAAVAVLFVIGVVRKACE